MASPAVRSLLGKSKLPLPLLIRGTTLTSPQSKADVGTTCFPKEVVPPPQSYVFLRKESEFFLGGGQAWALGTIGVANGREDGLRLGGRPPAVKDEDEDVNEEDWVEDDDDDDDDDDDLKDLDDSEDFDDEEDDFEDDEEVPRRKSK